MLDKFTKRASHGGGAKPDDHAKPDAPAQATQAEDHAPAGDGTRTTHQEPASSSDAENGGHEVAFSPDDVAAEATDDREQQQQQQEQEQPGADSSDDALYSVIPRRQRVAIIMIAAAAGVFSPMTSAIYLPALTSIARDMSVSTSLINLTITTYQIFQGIAPAFIGSLSDVRGRRPAYLVAFSIFLVANLALALQDNYAALMVLRCLQSAGSSATIALGMAVVADLVTRAERGRWLGYTNLGVSLGPALGPVIGGLLDNFLGWRSIFWFLLIAGGVIMLVIAALLPETARAVVGNGSVPPQRWNHSLLQLWRIRQHQPLNGGTPGPNGATGGHPARTEPDWSTVSVPRKRPNPLMALLILFELESGIMLLFGAINFGGYFMVMTTFSEALTARFHYSSAVVGLCYLPIGFGGLISRWTAGRLFDRNFRRHAGRLGLPVDLSRQQAIEVFPIERIRLEVCLPMVYVCCGCVLAYGWTMDAQASLAGILVSVFFMGLFFSGVQQGLNTLIVDLHADMPATATAANNLLRCLISAGATAIAPFLIERIGVGFMSVFIAGVWLCFTPCLWLVMLRGDKWRAAAKAKEDKRDARDAEKHRREQAA